MENPVCLLDQKGRYSGLSQIPSWFLPHKRCCPFWLQNPWCVITSCCFCTYMGCRCMAADAVERSGLNITFRVKPCSCWSSKGKWTHFLEQTSRACIYLTFRSLLKISFCEDALKKSDVVIVRMQFLYWFAHGFFFEEPHLRYTTLRLHLHLSWDCDYNNKPGVFK